MFGGTGKMGRGGSVGKRSIHAPRISRPTPTRRLPMGGGPRGRAAVSSPSTTSSLQVEESFSLVGENPLNFGMAIKLAPDLVEEIKRVEAQGGTARIKFDLNANNPNGNVIEVGEKNFRFTCSREPGDLCDIYEERQSGENGNGLLVESGGTWRKLNVERELDESTKNHVKRRSEEAERKLKSRKAIVLDHQNLAAPESNPRRNIKRESSFKKSTEQPSAGGPRKFVPKSVLPATTLPKVKLSSRSPLSSQPEQHGCPANVALQNINGTASSDKDMHGRVPNAPHEKTKHSQNTEASPSDLRNLIISLLLKNQHKGMNLKAMEKAIGDSMPNSARQIEPIVKQVATFQAPGKYFLKQGLEIEGLKQLPPQTESPPEIIRQPSPVLQSPSPSKFDQLPQNSSFSSPAAANVEEWVELNHIPVTTAGTIEKIDILHNSPEHFSDKKASDNIPGLAGSSTDSGSGSDSDSSGSGSGSDSESQSPVGSQSKSSSDSESDESSSSKQASDEDIDIMTSDDDKESEHKLLNSDLFSLKKSPLPWSHPDNTSIDIGSHENQDHVSDVVEIENTSPEDGLDSQRHADNYLYPNEAEKSGEGIKRSSVDDIERERRAHDREDRDGLDGVNNDSFKRGQSGSHEKLTKGKSKRRMDDRHPDDKARNRKKSRSENFSHPVSGTILTIFGESHYNSSPDRPLDGLDNETSNLLVTKTSSDGTNEPNIHKDFNHPARSVSDYQPSGQKLFGAHGINEVPSGEKRFGKHNSLDHSVKCSERNLQINAGLQAHKGLNAEAQIEDGLISARGHVNCSAEGVRDKYLTMTETHKKPDFGGKVKDSIAYSKPYTGSSPKDNNTSTTDRSPLMNGLSGAIWREASDLELGEFQEPVHDDTPGQMKQFDKRCSFKQLENKQKDSDYWSSDFSRGKPSNKVPADSRKLSPPNPVAIAAASLDGAAKRKSLERADDLARSNRTSIRSLQQHNISSFDHSELDYQQNEGVDISGKSRFAEAGAVEGVSSDVYGDASKKVCGNLKEREPTRGNGPLFAKESKQQTLNMASDSNNKRKDASLSGADGASSKKKESYSDENCSSFTKYEKGEPELKAPIRSASQYKEYVKEYQEKYESYCSLNNTLESYRNEFSNLGKDLEFYKGRDIEKYNYILEQMRSSFRQRGEKHKYLKKIFIVLYEELKHLKQIINDYAASYKKE